MTEEVKKGGNQGRYSLLVSLSTTVNKFCEVLLFVLMIAMIAATTAQVAFRLVTQALTWTEELTRFLLVFCSLVGATVAFYRGSHIALSVVVDYLPKPLRTLVFIVINLIELAFFAILAYYGITLMDHEAAQMTPALNISMKWLYMMFPAFSAVTILHLIAGVEKYLKGGNG